MRIILITILLNVFGCVSYSQNRVVHSRYDLIVEFIKKDIEKELRRSLREDCQGNDIDDKIHIAKKVVENEIKPVLCDYIRKHYNINESCVRLFGTNAPIVQSVKDSIELVRQNAQAENETLNQYLDKHAQDKKVGMLLFLSPSVRNTIMIEYMTFCESYQKVNSWIGKSKIYYFVFDDDNKIEDVYYGEKYYQ